MSRPEPSSLLGKKTDEAPMSCQRILNSSIKADSVWIDPSDAAGLTPEEKEAYEAAHTIIRHMAIEMPRAHKSGHPGGPLSAFTLAYWVTKLRDPSVDQPLRMSPGHLSILGYTLQYLFGRDGGDERLSSPEKLIETFRIPSGLPGHLEAGIGDIPFGTGPLGKGVSNALGVAFGLKYKQKMKSVPPFDSAQGDTSGVVDVVLADGDAQEGQVMEAFRLASHLQVDNLVVHGDFNDVQLSGLPTEVFASDFAAMARASGWQVIEVQNGNDPAQVKSAILKADEFVGKGRPIFICYYTTMGHGIALMEKGSDSGEKNFHGAPLSDEEAEEALKEIPDLDEAVKTYEPHRESEKKRYESGQKVVTDIPLVSSFETPQPRHAEELGALRPRSAQASRRASRSADAAGAPQDDASYERTITTEKGAARKDFGATHILNLMKVDPRIIVLHADLAGSGGFTKVEKEFPDRVINVGVAEANMVMMAAGMRQAGLLPVTYTFAAFGTNEARANARLIDINCGHTRCGVINDCTHSGISVGEDGETHQERHYLDIPFDNTEVWMPADSNQAGAMAEAAMELIAEGHKSVYVFSPRSSHPQLLDEKGQPIYGSDYVFDRRATIVNGSGDLEDSATIIAVGAIVHDAIEAAKTVESEEKVKIRVLNVASVRPLDASAIIQAALETQHLIVCEDHSSESGLASKVANVIADFQLPCSLCRMGVNHYYPSGPSDDLKIMAGLDAENIANVVQEEIRTEVCGGEDVLVSAIYSLPHNMMYSQFEEMAKEYVSRLKVESGYLEELRESWKKRECPKEELPSNEKIREEM